MSNLNISTSICVSDPANHVLWEKVFTHEELRQMSSSIHSENTISSFCAAFFPVRTNNLRNFSKDFILPTTLNRAIKVQNIVIKFFAIIFAVIFDVLTFPIRLLTCIPRMVSNANRENRFHAYLIGQNVSDNLLKSDYVQVTLWSEINSPNNGLSTEENGHADSESQEDYFYVTRDVNLIEIPYRISHPRLGAVGSNASSDFSQFMSNASGNNEAGRHLVILFRALGIRFSNR